MPNIKSYTIELFLDGMKIKNPSPSYSIQNL